MKRALALLVLLTRIAHADAPPRYRFHVVTDKLARKLSPYARRNERAVAAFPRATAFVVAADPLRPSRILMLTNHHVAGDGPPGDVTFRDGTVGKAIRTVASNPALDYAVVEVELASSPRAGGVEPLVVDRGVKPMHPGEPIYALGGHTGLDTFQNPRGSIAGGVRTEHDIAQTIAERNAHADVAGFRTIAVGKVAASSKKPQPIFASGNETMAIEAQLPNAPGMSGSPVFSKFTHQVVGLHFAGYGALRPDWTESSVPMNLILGDLRKQLASNAVRVSARDLVQRLAYGH